MTLRCRLVAFSLLFASVAFADRPAYFGFAFTYHPPVSTEKNSGGWLVVRATLPDGPADRGGLRTNDFIVQIAGQPVTFTTELDVLQRLAAFRPGDVVRLTILRDRKRHEIQFVGVPMSDRQYEQWKANMELARDSARSRKSP